MPNRPTARRGRHLRLVREPETAPASAPKPKRQKPVRVAAATTFRPDEVDALEQIFDCIMRGGTMQVNERTPAIVSAYSKIKSMAGRVRQKERERRQ